jgi:hypothetical protein
MSFPAPTPGATTRSSTDRPARRQVPDVSIDPVPGRALACPEETKGSVMSDQRTLRIVAAVALVLGAALFAIGIGREHSGHEASSAVESSPQGEVSEQTEADEGTTGVEGATQTHPSAEADAVLLGIDLESTPFVVLAVVASIALGALLLSTRARWVLVVMVAFALVFALADVRELLKQIDESHAGIAAIAVGVLAFHAIAVAAGTAGARSATG